MSDKGFLSFTFDGKAIESFGLAVVSGGGRYTQNLYPNFQNVTTEVMGKRGIHYWRTNIGQGDLILQLATDQMTSRQYRSFISHFKPNRPLKLSLAERPFCYSYAILNGAPVFTFVPFEREAKVMVAGVEKTYIDTLYKGEVTLSFLFPDPFWYGEYATGYRNLITKTTFEDENWFFESNLPLETWFLAGEEVFLADSHEVRKSDGAIINTNLPLHPVSGTKSFYYYNAGNAQAEATIKIIKKILVSDGLPAWEDVKISIAGPQGTILIRKPRFIRDIEYAINRIGDKTDLEWTVMRLEEVDKAILSLDSCLSERILSILENTGNGFAFSVLGAKNQILDLIKDVDVTFSLKGPIAKAMFIAGVDTLTPIYEENVGDSTTLFYLLLEGVNSLTDELPTYSNGVFTLKSVNVEGVISDFKLEFKNTYE